MPSTCFMDTTIGCSKTKKCSLLIYTQQIVVNLLRSNQFTVLKIKVICFVLIFLLLLCLLCLLFCYSLCWFSFAKQNTTLWPYQLTHIYCVETSLSKLIFFISFCNEWHTVAIVKLVRSLSFSWWTRCLFWLGTLQATLCRIFDCLLCFEDWRAGKVHVLNFLN